MGVVKASYSRSSGGGAKSSKQATRYAAHREGEDAKQGGREIYDKENDSISRQEAYRKVEQADQQSKDAYHYRLTLSHAKTGEGVDHKATTRETMGRLEERHAQQGGKVSWHAVNHTDHSNHEHTHVIAVTEKRISASDLAEMRREMDRSYERHTPRDVDRQPERATPRQEAEPVKESQHRGGVEAGREPPRAEQGEKAGTRQEAATVEAGRPGPAKQDQGDDQKRRRESPEWHQMQWQTTGAMAEEQYRDRRLLQDRPSLITSGEASKEYAQYKQVEGLLDKQEQREMFVREMEWRNEQRSVGRDTGLSEAYFVDHAASLRDMNEARKLEPQDRQRFLDKQADERWRHRAVNDYGMRGDELERAYKERQAVRQQERAAFHSPEVRERLIRTGEARREYNSAQHQRQDKEAQAWSERPPRQQRQEQRNDVQSQQRTTGGHDR